MELVASEWGKAKTFPLPFITYGATDWLSGVSLELGDVQIAINGGGYENIPLNQLTVVADHILITISNAQMQFKYAIVRVKDQTGTKVFEDTGAILTTTMHAWNQMLFTLIESQRGSHTAIHDIFYWDPVGGNDLNSGETFHEAKLTYTYNGAGGIHSLLNANEHQLVMLLPNASGGPTTVNEYIEVDKAYTFLRGPGRDFLIEATHNESCVIKASAEGVELSGMRIKTKTEGSQDGICATGDFASIRKVWVDYSRGDGFRIDNASSCILDDFLVQDAAQGGSGHAVHIFGDTSLTEKNIVGDGKIFSNGNGGGGADGIRIDGAYCKHNFVTGGATGLYIHDNTGYGIQEVNGADETIIVGPTIYIGHNTLGDIKLIGSESTAENWQQWAKDIDMQIALNGIAAIPTNPVTVLSATGYVKDVYWASAGRFKIKESEDINIPFFFEGNPIGLELWFVVAQDLKNGPILIKKQLAEGVDWDIVQVDGVDRVEGTLPFVYADTDTLHGEYTAAVIVKKSVDASYTGWESTLVVSRPVAKKGDLV